MDWTSRLVDKGSSLCPGPPGCWSKFINGNGRNRHQSVFGKENGTINGNDWKARAGVLGKLRHAPNQTRSLNRPCRKRENASKDKR